MADLTEEGAVGNLEIMPSPQREGLKSGSGPLEANTRARKLCWMGSVLGQGCARSGCHVGRHSCHQAPRAAVSLGLEEALPYYSPPC